MQISKIEFSSVHYYFSKYKINISVIRIFTKIRISRIDKHNFNISKRDANHFEGYNLLQLHSFLNHLKYLHSLILSVGIIKFIFGYYVTVFGIN